MRRRLARWALPAAAVLFGYLAYVYLTLPDVRPLARSNPQTTAFMELRAREARGAGRTPRRLQRWVGYDRISQHLKRAVLVSEDSAFWRHEGLDLEELKKSIERNLEKGRLARGGSTITQQLAKNLYLSPTKSPTRKLRELILARRLEAELSKRRILELYLNVVEWGDGIYGAEAAARAYFGTSAASLRPEQAALLAGALVNARALNPARPGTRLLRRQRVILARMGTVTPPTLPASLTVPAEPQMTADPADSVDEAAPEAAAPQP